MRLRRDGMLRTLYLLMLLAACVGAGACTRAGGFSAYRDSMPEHPFTGPAATPSETPVPTDETPAVTLAHLDELKDILPALDKKRVIYVGETHDQYAHHLVQLEIIRHLHEVDPRLAIGVEFFQQPFQEKLDDYAAGKLDERRMLMETGYFERWGYDYRLYAPIVRYARDNGLPLVALNVSSELVKLVRERGLEGLSPADRARLPSQIDRTDAAYVSRVREAYEQHPGHASLPFERFLDVQLVWDEGMAERAADYLRHHPDYRMVVLTGSGHVAFGDGIPKRLDRRLPVESAIVLAGWAGPLSPEVGDYLLMPRERPLSPAGKIGVALLPESNMVKVVSCATDSPCTRAGLQKGDELVAIDGVPITDMNGVRALLWDRKPGDVISVTTRRAHLISAPETADVRIELR
jgi:uncharacterized iron-regulated protein